MNKEGFFSVMKIGVLGQENVVIEKNEKIFKINTGLYASETKGDFSLKGDYSLSFTVKYRTSSMQHPEDAITTTVVRSSTSFSWNNSEEKWNTNSTVASGVSLWEDLLLDENNQLILQYTLNVYEVYTLSVQVKFLHWESAENIYVPFEHIFKKATSGYSSINLHYKKENKQYNPRKYNSSYDSPFFNASDYGNTAETPSAQLVRFKDETISPNDYLLNVRTPENKLPEADVAASGCEKAEMGLDNAVHSFVYTYQRYIDSPLSLGTLKRYTDDSVSPDQTFYNCPPSIIVLLQGGGGAGAIGGVGTEEWAGGGTAGGCTFGMVSFPYTSSTIETTVFKIELGERGVCEDGINVDGGNGGDTTLTGNNGTLVAKGGGGGTWAGTGGQVPFKTTSVSFKEDEEYIGDLTFITAAAGSGGQDGKGGSPRYGILSRPMVWSVPILASTSSNRLFNCNQSVDNYGEGGGSVGHGGSSPFSQGGRYEGERGAGGGGKVTYLISDVGHSGGAGYARLIW